MEEKQEMTLVKKAGVFDSIATFEDAQRMVKPLSTSQLIPDQFRGRIDDCLIALEISHRIGVTPLTVLQNIYIVHGKPSWSSQFLISLVNASGYFATPLRYKMIGEPQTDSWGCIAWVKDKDGEVLEGPAVTILMAKSEGWMSKAGSKWKTMPEVMLRYRAAALFTRFFAPEIAMGLKTREEIIDIETLPASRFENPLDGQPVDVPPPVPQEIKEEEVA